MVLKICIFFLEIGIFNTIFYPTGKNLDDQIIYSWFKVFVWVKYAYKKMYIVQIASFFF